MKNSFGFETLDREQAWQSLDVDIVISASPSLAFAYAVFCGFRERDCFANIILNVVECFVSKTPVLDCCGQGCHRGKQPDDLNGSTLLI
eukprot:jgi/Botrbrau1/4697/Bobra.0218s0018.1